MASVDRAELAVSCLSSSGSCRSGASSRREWSSAGWVKQAVTRDLSAGGTSSEHQLGVVHVACADVAVVVAAAAAAVVVVVVVDVVVAVVVDVVAAAGVVL